MLLCKGKGCFPLRGMGSLWLNEETWDSKAVRVRDGKVSGKLFFFEAFFKMITWLIRVGNIEV